MYNENKCGRPLKFETVEILQEKIDKYFADCDADKRPYTVTGLAYDLDTDRQTLLNYEGREGYLDTIKRAKEKCARYAEEQLYRTSQVAGVIFAMKNNYGFKDVQEVVNTNNSINVQLED